MVTVQIQVLITTADLILWDSVWRRLDHSAGFSYDSASSQGSCLATTAHLLKLFGFDHEALQKLKTWFNLEPFYNPSWNVDPLFSVFSSSTDWSSLSFTGKCWIDVLRNVGLRIEIVSVFLMCLYISRMCHSCIFFSQTNSSAFYSELSKICPLKR